MKLVKICFDKKYTDKKGNEKYCVAFALKLDNGSNILIKPINVNDYSKLDVLSSEFIDLRKSNAK